MINKPSVTAWNWDQQGAYMTQMYPKKKVCHDPKCLRWPVYHCITSIEKWACELCCKMGLVDLDRLWASPPETMTYIYIIRIYGPAFPAPLWCGGGVYLYWLVVWNIFLFSILYGNFIIPTDEVIFFRGVGIATTR